MPAAAATAAREILTGLHALMARRGSPQAKLDHVVDLIAGAMTSEVCSIYLARDSLLELWATHGLRKEAVHVTRLAFGEGLTGTIAQEGRVLNLAEAASHPGFAYRPETGEEHFHSFAACRSSTASRSSACWRSSMPIRAATTMSRSRRCRRSPWSCPNSSRRARLVDATRRGERRDSGSVRLAGLKLVAGMARGVAVFHEPRVIVLQTVAEDTEAERARVYAAFRRMREQIENMTREAEFGTIGEHNEILETYKMFAYDEGWSRRINEAIDSGLTAEAAIERVSSARARRMRDIDDPLLKERMHDLDDLANRLLRIVSGRLGHRPRPAPRQGRRADRPQSRPGRAARIRPPPAQGRRP